MALPDFPPGIPCEPPGESFGPSPGSAGARRAAYTSYRPALPTSHTPLVGPGNTMRQHLRGDDAHTPRAFRRYGWPHGRHGVCRLLCHGCGRALVAGRRRHTAGGSVNGEELSDPKFHPFWAKAEELGVLVFLHLQGVPDLAKRLKGNGLSTNVIGNPLETTIALSHLIFEGTLDRFPGLKLCAAHGGGYLPSYSARSDHGCLTFPDR